MQDAHQFADALLDGIPSHAQVCRLTQHTSELQSSRTSGGSRRYRLKTITVAVNEENLAIFIPADSVLSAGADSENAIGLVTVEWGGKHVQMFGVDLHDRGELLVERAASAVDSIEADTALTAKARDCDHPRAVPANAGEVRGRTHLSVTGMLRIEADNQSFYYDMFHGTRSSRTACDLEGGHAGC